MPIRRCQCPDGPTGYRWGQSGTCYCGEGARRKAERQARAIASRRADSAERAGRVYRHQRASDRALVRVMERYIGELSKVYRAALVDASHDVAGMLPRADNKLVRFGKVELTAEQAQTVADRLRRAIREARRRAENVTQPTDEARKTMESMASQAARAERQYLVGLGADRRKLSAVLRVPLDELVGVRVALSPQEQVALTELTQAAFAVIESQAGRMALGYEAEISRRVVAGARWETIAGHLESRVGMDRRHARLIGRDQTNKLNAGITQATHAAASIDRYIWRATIDGLVRDSHEAVDGLVVAWSDPPDGTGPYGEAAHAGDAIQCRCQAEGVVPPHLRLDDTDTSPMPEVGDRV